MQYLIFITFFVFLIFWLGDLAITLKTVKHLGPKIEINPILRVILKFRGRFVYIFKTVEIGAFLYLIWYLSKFEGEIPFYILLVFILFYSLLVVNNAHIYYKATEKESGAFKLVYIGLILALLAFIYLNYLLYLDIGIINGALVQSNDKYNGLYEECQKKCEAQNQTIESTIPEDLHTVLQDLNLPIRR